MKQFWNLIKKAFAEGREISKLGWAAIFLNKEKGLVLSLYF